MRVVVIVITCMLLFLFTVPESFGEQVKGYAKKSGKYVGSYPRSKRNKSKMDNYRVKGDKRPRSAKKRR